MGSPLRLTLGGGEPLDRPEAERAWRDVVAEFEAADAAMSRFRDDSELTALNRRAGPGVMTRPSRRLRTALAAADRAHRLSGGRFDPRVLDDLDRLGYRGAPLGVEPAVADRPEVGPSGESERIVGASGRDIRTVARRIDLGGIGKGLTLRWAAERLRRRGVGDFLLEAGGDIVARGRAPDGGKWLVGIEDPRGDRGELAVISVVDGAVATSSVRINRWVTDGRPVHHLLDPVTGTPADDGLAAVTVAGSDPAWAEVWSKALFVRGRDRIAEEARSRGLAAWWVTKEGALEMTAAARARTTWVLAEAV